MKSAVILLIGTFIFSTAQAKDQPLTQIDMLIYNSSKVANYDEWITKFVPEKERDSRRKIFKAVLKEKFPALMQNQDEILFYNSGSHKMESLTIISLFGINHYFLNGKDVSSYPGESTERWMGRVFSFKTSSNFLNLFTPEANADESVALGEYLGAAITSAAKDTSAKYGSVSVRVSGSGYTRTDVDMPSRDAVETLKKEMQARVLSEMKNLKDLQCIETRDAKYAGAKFSTDVDGRKMTFTSKPQDEMPSFGLTIADATNNNVRSEALYNQASSNFSVRRYKDGQFSTESNSTGAKNLVKSLSSPFFTDDRMKMVSTYMTKEEGQQTANWLNKADPDDAKNYLACLHVGYISAASSKDSRYPRIIGGVEEENIYFMQYLRQRTDALQNKQLLDACRIYAEIASLDYKKSEIPRSYNPFSDNYSARSKLDSDQQALKEKLAQIPENYREIANSSICNRAGDTIGREVAADDFSAPENVQFMNLGPSEVKEVHDMCFENLISRLPSDKPSFFVSIQARLKAAQENNSLAREKSKAFSRRLSNLEKNVSLSEAATACCRMKPCREAMSAEAKVIKDSKETVK